MTGKTKIFNLALQGLFINKRIVNADTDSSTEAFVLRTQYDLVYIQALSELDLDSTSQTKTLELLTTSPNQKWRYAYRYPSDVALLRRIDNCGVTDDKETVIHHRVELFGYNGSTTKVIMTNENNSTIEYISIDTPEDTLSVEALRYIAYRLSEESVSLIVGEKSQTVMQTLKPKILEALIAARRKDGIETQVHESDWKLSSFVKARMS